MATFQWDGNVKDKWSSMSLLRSPKDLLYCFKENCTCESVSDMELLICSSGESGHICLVSELSDKASNIFPFSMMLTLGFHVFL